MIFDFSRGQLARAGQAIRDVSANYSLSRAAKRLILIPAMLTAAGLAMAQTAGTVQSTNLVSVSSAGFAGNQGSPRAAMSADGRFIAFDSFADNLVPGDTNGTVDIFVHDYQTGTTERVSVDSAGQQIAEGGVLPSISADGRYVAFVSTDLNLVPGKTSNVIFNVFLHDRQTGTLELIDVDDTGVAGASSSYVMSVSADGRYVAFFSFSSNLVAGDTNGWEDVFVRDRQTGTTERVSVSSTGEQANSFSSHGAISDDGRYVAFVSPATNLVPDDTNSIEDIFVRDRVNGTTTRVNVTSAGEQALHTPDNGGDGVAGTWSMVAISGDGRFVAFDSRASNLDPADTNEEFDVFVHDQQTGTTELVSVDNAGVRAGGTNPFINRDGRYVVFGSGGNIVPGVTAGVYVRDRVSGSTELLSVDNSGALLVANDGGRNTPISADGQFIAFGSNSTQLIPNDAEFPPVQVYLRNRGPQDGQTPSVSAGETYIVNLGDPVTLAATGFDPNGDPLTYAWDFDNDGAFETPGQSVTFPTDSFAGSANYNVRVQVTDATGLTGTASALVAITSVNLPPTVDAGGPYTVNEGGTVTLTATGSDPNGDPLGYEWDFDNNGTFERSGQSVTYSAADLDGPTTRTVSVQVMDPAGLTATSSATITVNNVAPTADAGGPYVVNEGGSVMVTATGSDAASADVLTYTWDLDNNGSFETPGQSAAFSAADIDGPATRTIHVQVSDDDGGVTTASATVTVDNVAPTLDAGGPYVVNEGGSVTLTATAVDAPADTLVYAWDLDNNGTFETPGRSATFSAATLDGPTTSTVHVRVSDNDGATVTASTAITIENVAPMVSAITVPVDPMPIGTTFSASATFTDPATADTHTAVWNWGDGAATAAAVSSGTATGSHGYTTTGVYPVGLTVTDDDGGQGNSDLAYAVAYDPSSGVVTGGGTIASPAGGYAADPTVSGIAKLGFVSTIPRKTTAQVGTVAFQLDVAGIDFRSGGLASLTLNRARAGITGSGMLNGVSGYSFLVAVIDGEARGGGGVDRFRIKIWNANGVVYDNEPGTADDADPVTALQSGSVLVQKTGAKGS